MLVQLIAEASYDPTLKLAAKALGGLIVMLVMIGIWLNKSAEVQRSVPSSLSNLNKAQKKLYDEFSKKKDEKLEDLRKESPKSLVSTPKLGMALGVFLAGRHGYSAYQNPAEMSGHIEMIWHWMLLLVLPNLLSYVILRGKGTQSEGRLVAGACIAGVQAALFFLWGVLLIMVDPPLWGTIVTLGVMALLHLGQAVWIADYRDLRLYDQMLDRMGLSHSKLTEEEPEPEYLRRQKP